MSNAPTYQQTIDYLYAQLPMFSKQGKSAIKADLSNTLKLTAALGEPQEQFKSIHIAGTNGKGSVCHMLAAILQRSGYKVGLYTSPHLIDFRERVRINGEPVSEAWVIDFVGKHKELIETTQPSFFEITVAMAFQAFADEDVDIAIIETGLGGRLDSTNVISPILSVITNIDYDHTDILGDTLAKIADEKAGIIKEDVPVVIGQQHDETERVFFEHSVRKHSPMYHADVVWDIVRTPMKHDRTQIKLVNKATQDIYDIHCDLTGGYQSANIKTTLTSVDVLNAKCGFKIELGDAISALSNVKGLTGLRGRWDIISKRPYVVADVAHNPAGLKAALQQLANVDAKQKHVVIGFVRDKDINAALQLLPKEYSYYYCNANIPRALPVDELKTKADAAELSGTAHTSVANAVAAAARNLNGEDVLLIIGSVFVVGEALSFIDSKNDLFTSTLEEDI